MVIGNMCTRSLLSTFSPVCCRLGLDPKLLARILNSSSGRCWSSELYNPCPGVVDGVPSSNDYNGGFGAALMAKVGFFSIVYLSVCLSVGCFSDSCLDNTSVCVYAHTTGELSNSFHSVLLYSVCVVCPIYAGDGHHSTSLLLLLVLSLLVQDLNLAQRAAMDLKAATPLGEHALLMYNDLCSKGLDKKDFSVMYKYLQGL